MLWTSYYIWFFFFGFIDLSLRIDPNFVAHMMCGLFFNYKSVVYYSVLETCDSFVYYDWASIGLYDLVPCIGSKCQIWKMKKKGKKKGNKKMISERGKKKEEEEN